MTAKHEGGTMTVMSTEPLTGLPFGRDSSRSRAGSS